jgi:hypothetical protein
VLTCFPVFWGNKLEIIGAGSVDTFFKAYAGIISYNVISNFPLPFKS